MKIYLAEQLDKECKDSYIIPQNTSKIIYCENEREIEIDLFNNIATYTSRKKKICILLFLKKKQQII